MTSRTAALEFAAPAVPLRQQDLLPTASSFARVGARALPHLARAPVPRRQPTRPSPLPCASRRCARAPHLRVRASCRLAIYPPADVLYCTPGRTSEPPTHQQALCRNHKQQLIFDKNQSQAVSLISSKNNIGTVSILFLPMICCYFSQRDAVADINLQQSHLANIEITNDRQQTKINNGQSMRISSKNNK